MKLYTFAVCKYFKGHCHFVTPLFPETFQHIPYNNYLHELSPLLHTVYYTVYNMRMCTKEDNPGSK